jgi:hypothetical protein
VLSAEQTIGVLTEWDGRIRQLMRQDYFRELPRGRVVSEVPRLEDASTALLSV